MIKLRDGNSTEINSFQLRIRHKNDQYRRWSRSWLYVEQRRVEPRVEFKLERENNVYNKGGTKWESIKCCQ